MRERVRVALAAVALAPFVVLACSTANGNNPAGPRPDGGGGSSGGGGDGSVACATSTPASLDTTQFMKMEQLVVAPDGTIYYSTQHSNIGRWLPPYTAPLDTMWLV